MVSSPRSTVKPQRSVRFTMVSPTGRVGPSPRVRWAARLEPEAVQWAHRSILREALPRLEIGWAPSPEGSVLYSVFLGFFQGGQGPKWCFPGVGDPKQCGHPKDTCTGLEPSSGCSPAMLHNLIFPDKQTVGFHSGYDYAIERYLAGTPAGASKSRRENLVLSWPEEGLKKNQKPCEPADAGCYQQRLVALQNGQSLFADNNKPEKLTISDLTERANKLADLRSVVARMNRDLSRLTEDLAAELQCPPLSAIDGIRFLVMALQI